jgi:BirA family transcriptional regulator, biotin operon repressor / biotin---[acetyl-CoA-carboxylase] ligase
MDQIEHWYKYYNILIFDSIDSTNEEAKRIAKSDFNGEFFIWGKSQTNGRGRSKKEWLSPPGNLCLSLLLTPKIDITKISQIPFLVAVALGETIASLKCTKSINIEYKWPNDILINDKKAAGILIETSMVNTHIEWLVIGIGVNIRSAPEISNYKTTCLADEGIDISTLDFFIHNFMQNFQKYYYYLTSQGFIAIKELWLNRAKSLGKTIIANSNQNRVVGIFDGIDDYGNLQLIIASGEKIKISSGEVFLYNSMASCY